MAIVLLGARVMDAATIWLEYVKLAVSALTPILTGVIGLMVLRLGNRLERSRQLNQTLLSKRLLVFDQIAPKLNDIFCFFRAVGHWSELDPQEIIKRKRDIDRTFHVNEFLFDKRLRRLFAEFEAAHFDTFSTAGGPAKLRMDVDHVRRLMAHGFQADWHAALSAQPGNVDQQTQAYQKLMERLGKEVKGDDWDE
jgi:hypothetical protein